MTRWLGLLLVASTLACGAHRSSADEEVELYTAGATASERLPLVFVLHGYGGAPWRIARILDGLGVRARIIAPHGLFRVGTGWGWFGIHWDKSPDEIAPSIAHAADVVAQRIAATLHDRPTCGRPIVTGFSQGGFLSYALAARSPPVVGAAFPIGGFLPPALRPTSKPADAPHVEAFHGDADEVVLPPWDRDTNARFVAAGFDATLHTYAGVSHDISPEEAAAVCAAIERAIREEGCVSPAAQPRVAPAAPPAK